MTNNGPTALKVADQLIAEYREALRDLYGEREAASYCLFYKNGWFNVAKGVLDGDLITFPKCDKYRKSMFLQMIQSLKNRIEHKPEEMSVKETITDEDDSEMVFVSTEFLDNILSTMWFARTFVPDNQVGGVELITALENHCADIKKVIG